VAIPQIEDAIAFNKRLSESVEGRLPTTVNAFDQALVTTAGSG
jgi:hypothetical protein